MNATDLKRLVTNELEWLSCKPGTLALVTTTSRAGVDFTVTPRRTAFGHNCICFLFGGEAAAATVLPMLDGKVDAILADIEGKKPFDLYEMAIRLAPGTKVIPCKPNDATLEALDQLLRSRIGPSLAGRRILVYGIGNIGAKALIRLAESGAQVTACSRDMPKCRAVVAAVNAILPKYASGSIETIDTLDGIAPESLDAVVSCASSPGVIGEGVAGLLKKSGAVAVDCGIDNFSAAFCEAAQREGLELFRLDVRIGFPYLALQATGLADAFVREACGSRVANGIRLVSGGMIGRRGDVIVDNFSRPTQIVGLASGTGGVLKSDLMSAEEKASLATAASKLFPALK